MRKKLVTTIFSLMIILIFSIAASGYAPQSSSKPNLERSKSEKCKGQHGGKYHELSKTLLLQKLGLTKEEVKAARESGKGFMELAKEKGNTPDMVKTKMIEAKTEAINQAVKDGKLTKDEGDKKIIRMKERVKNWDGSMKHKSKNR